MIEQSQVGDVACIRLARPAARNAISVSGWRLLADTVRSLATRNTRAAILCAEGTTFSAGADITEFAGFVADRQARVGFRLAMRDAIDAIAASPVPIVAAIDGGCHGAAVALVLACDVRIAGDQARFAVPPARLGLLYPQADVRRLVDAVGRGRASHMLLAGNLVDADTATAWGLADLRVPRAGPAALDLARTIAANGPGAVAGLRRLIRGHHDDDAAFDAAFDGRELAEGLAAFSTRRTPDFR